MPKPIYVSVKLTPSEAKTVDFLRRRFGVKTRAGVFRITLLRASANERFAEMQEQSGLRR